MGDVGGLTDDLCLWMRGDVLCSGVSSSDTANTGTFYLF